MTEAPPFAVALEGASNLRDLGGYRAANGGVVRRHLVYRAPALIHLTASDERTIAGLDIRTVVDLRGTRERGYAPVTIPGAAHIHLPIEPTVGANLKDILRTGQLSGHVSAGDMRELLGQAYRAYATQSLPVYRELVRLIGEGELPLLFHCSAGKDRTGFGAALLLTLLGVARPDVEADYLATNHFWRRENARHFNLPPDVADVLLGAHVPLLHQALGLVETATLLPAAQLDRLRARLLLHTA